jgi:hypothetical protein
MYQKPADVKGETKVLKKAEQQHNLAKENIKVAKSSKSRLGKIFGALAAGLLLWATFKDKIIELWNKYSGKIWEGLQWLGGKIWEGLQWVGGKIWEWLQWLGGKVWEGLEWLWGEFGPSIWKGLQWLGEKVWKGLQWLGELFGNIWTNVKIALGKGFLMVVRGVDSLLAFMTAAFKNLIKVLIMLPVTIARHVAAWFLKHAMKHLMRPIKGLISLVGKIPGLGKTSRRLNEKIDAGIEKAAEITAGPSIGEQLVDIKVKQEEGPGALERSLIERGTLQKFGADEKGQLPEYVPLLPKTGVFEDKPGGIPAAEAWKNIIETSKTFIEEVKGGRKEGPAPGPDYSVAAAAWRAEVARQEKEDREFRERSHFRTQPWPGSPKDDPWGYRRAKAERARQGLPDRAVRWQAELQARRDQGLKITPDVTTFYSPQFRGEIPYADSAESTLKKLKTDGVVPGKDTRPVEEGRGRWIPWKGGLPVAPTHKGEGIIPPGAAISPVWHQRWGRDELLRVGAGASVAKPFTGYRPTTIAGSDTSKTDDILTSSEGLLQKIEQNTRGGMGNTVVNAGQRGGGQQRGSSPNTISPNTATVGAPKKDSHYTYADSDYIERPNTLVS